MSEAPETPLRAATRALASLKDERERMAAIYKDSVAGRIQLEAYDRTIQSAEQRIAEMSQ